ncbi:MAG TPA: DUF2889 domain-containing protein, partial [Myxococcota bacterium]|nr:DUF2889 domain-containing protein [Myxococcota bacterium]
MFPRREVVSAFPLRSDYGGGIYRRRIRLAAERGLVRGSLVDDFHDFTVRLEHDGARVSNIEGQARRIPWFTCPGAADPLKLLEGLPLTRSLRSIARHTDPRAQCTHLFDLASLAVSFAACGKVERAYELAVPDRVGARTRATLLRDGVSVLRWEIDGARIEDPPPFAGRSLAGGGFLDWVETTLDADQAEAAQVLRRAVVISYGRRFDFDRV